MNRRSTDQVGARTMRAVAVLLAILIQLCANADVAGAQVPATTPNAGTLAGVVRDTLGRPMRDIEVSLPDIGRTTRTDADGKFLLADVSRGQHQVWVRGLGYLAAQFNWESTAGSRIDVAVKMQPLPNTLDPVVVYAEEERNMKSRSLIAGILADTGGRPIDGAEVQLIGAQRSTYTDATGAFVFRNVSPGDLTVRARLMGFTPAAKRVTLRQDDDRRVYLMMTPLAQMLDEERVTAGSGFGPHQDVWVELDRRLRLRAAHGSSIVIGPDQLVDRGKMPLDKFFHEAAGGAYSTTSIRSDAVITPYDPKVSGDVCILEDGWRPMMWNLRAYTADDLEMIEYYPAVPPTAETEHSATVAFRMSTVPGCERNSNGKHPAYYVLWRKGSR